MIVIGTKEDSINEVFRELEKFTRVAGPKLNINKSEILLTGTFKSSHTFGTCAVKTAINCLGISIGMITIYVLVFKKIGMKNYIKYNLF